MEPRFFHFFSCFFWCPSGAHWSSEWAVHTIYIYYYIYMRSFWPKCCRGPCEKMLWRSWWNPGRGPCMNPNRSLWEDLLKILLTSLKSPCVILHRSLWEDLVETLVKSSLRGPCMILCRSLTENLVEILARSSLRGHCMRSLQVSCLRGACMKSVVGGSWEVLVSRSCKIRYSRSRSFCGDLVGFFGALAWRSWSSACCGKWCQRP